MLLICICIMCIQCGSGNSKLSNDTNNPTKVKSVTEIDLVVTTKHGQVRESSKTVHNSNDQYNVKHFNSDHEENLSTKKNLKRFQRVNSEEELSQFSLRSKKKKTKPKKHESEIIEDISLSESDSVGFESDDVRVNLREGEEFLDFSDLAKMKSFPIDNRTSQSSENYIHFPLKENPLLNWTCSLISLQKERNISTGFLDKRIANVIDHAEDYPEGGTQLIEDMKEFYCYLKHVNQLVASKERRGNTLMKNLVEEDPEFSQIEFDTEELADHFSWIEEEVDAFEKLMDGICYQWKCLVARYTQKKHQ
ncbi:hypothetical protein J6590_058665 [Homalodisca vitripennis]|nr:hypothetical protein J6590_058665 [Homalodisca vitripennis]